ncbi:hypothetical protein QTN47_17125 [Danxiaibacter flavus]|uniref:Glycoside hydrolase family 19 protein n=1 Tax=Danxiaibacter flavus TaxID=3049108 RepID=A0ABV3ZIB1_9BACT|nr:hypothetical protein QNM32_17135 [Chitinophagaceae bacterium DXS]
MSKITTNNLITGEILNKICAQISAARASQIADVINQVFPTYGMTDPRVMQAAIAQIAHESGEFSIKSENMNYTTPERIMAVWPSRFKTVADAKPYIKNAQALANRVYGGRMGNNQPNDGYSFRGGGFMQLTGRESYEKYARYKGLSVEQIHEQIKTSDFFAMDSACWEFSIDKALIDEAMTGNFLTITKRINGGLIGWNERQKYFDRAKQFISH